MVFYILRRHGNTTVLPLKPFRKNLGTWGEPCTRLFQIMTLESWSEGISRPVMAVYPYAWIYFTSYVLITAFVVLNLFIGIIVSTMQETHYEEENRRRDAKEAAAHAEREEMLSLIRELNTKVDALQSARSKSDK
jgi:voltage-gated sodium channel